MTKVELTCECIAQCTKNFLGRSEVHDGWAIALDDNTTFDTIFEAWRSYIAKPA